MKYYLAYGSNLNVEQMKYRCPKAIPVGRFELKDYELLFKGSKSGSYLTVEKHEGKVVPIGVWKVDDSDELSLDRYEGYPSFYYKKELEIEFTSFRGLKVHSKAFIYIMHEERKIGIPSKAYVQTCLEGYRNFGFDIKHLEDALRISFKEVK